MKPENKLSQSVQQLANTNEVTIVQAIGDLRKYGKDAVPVLVEALKEKRLSAEHCSSCTW
ncbi:hypothetical protein BsIDN1_03370 [Bacillus safensis]|uniref:Uncharacterized protein n=1 Tax=Bacillus safensis TaxID=561879 RepID=A0A5S9M488_BACIA|nr:hypothetical protein BsIDN1_03370 [Bacillus safensis]